MVYHLTEFSKVSYATGVIEIHCYNCGEFIAEPSQISHRVSTSMLHKTFGAVPTSVLCTCATPVVYGPVAGRSSWPAQPQLN